MQPTARIAAALLLTLLLAACGGGDHEDPALDTQPVNCQASPQRCL